MDDSSTNYTTQSSTLSEFIKKDLSEDGLEKLDNIVDLLNAWRITPDAERLKQLSNEHISYEKGILYSHLKDLSEKHQVEPPLDFQWTVDGQIFKNQNEKYSTSLTVLRKKLDKLQNELQCVNKLIDISKRIRSRIESKHDTSTRTLNDQGIEDQIKEQRKQFKRDLHTIMEEIFPDYADDVANLLQDLFNAYNQGGTASYLSIEPMDIPLVTKLINHHLVETHPTDPTRIRFLFK